MWALQMNEFVEQARTYLGVPWRHMGRNRAGVDCVGLLTCVAYDLGITDYVPEPYRRVTDVKQLLTPIKIFCSPKPTDDLEPGDVLVFSMAGIIACHVGVVSDTNTLIHAFIRKRKVVEEPLSLWMDDVCANFRVDL